MLSKLNKWWTRLGRQTTATIRSKKGQRGQPSGGKARRVILDLETFEDRIAPAAGTATSIVSSANTGPGSFATYDQVVTFTATVRANAGSFDNGGSVTFYAGPGLTNQIGSPVNLNGSNSVSVNDTFTALGTYTITAVYNGDAAFFGSSGALTQIVAQNGLTPSQIRTAYGINSIPYFAQGQGTPNGTGQTIAIIDGGGIDPNIISDLGQFDVLEGLPAPPSFSIYNVAGQNINNLLGDGGQTINGVVVPPDMGLGNWAGETSLDVEWAHAIAPGAAIDLVFSPNLQAGVPTAAGLPGVSVVSMSWGGGEVMGETTDDSQFIKSGVVFLAATGDFGWPGDYPTYSPNVIAVGGTNLNILNSSGAYGNETAWVGSGGGTSTMETEPTYQYSVEAPFSLADPLARRTIPDVSFDAGPSTPVAIFDSYDSPTDPQTAVGGTSAATPCWAGLIAIADQGLAAVGEPPLNTGPGNQQQALSLLYSLPSTDFHAVTGNANNDQVSGVTMQSGGAGYVLSVVFSGGGGSGATGTVVTSNGQVTGVSIPGGSVGSGYTSPPTVTFFGGTTAATGIATISGGAVTGVTIPSGDGGSGYLSVSFSGGGVSSGQATGYPVVSGGQITGVVMDTGKGDGGYTSAPSVSFSGAFGGGAQATASIIGFTSGPTYNEVTGLGTPIANLLVPDLVTTNLLYLYEPSANLTLELSPTNSSIIQLYSGQSLVAAAPIGSFNRIQVVNTPGYSLTLNFTYGNFIPSKGLTSSFATTLDLEGGSFTNESIIPSGPNSGQITLDGSSISYQSTTAIDDTTTVANLTAYGTNNHEDVYVDNDPNVTENGVPTDYLYSEEGTFTPDYFGNKANFTVQGGTSDSDTYTFNVQTAAAQLGTMEFIGGVNQSTSVNVENTPVIMMIDGGSSTIVTVGYQGSVQGVSGPVDLFGGLTSLTVDDSSDGGNHTITMQNSSLFPTTNGEITGLLAVGSDIVYKYSAITGITLKTGAKTNTVSILTESIAESGSINIVGNSPNTTVNVGWNGNTHSIDSSIYVTDNTGTAAVVVNDSADSTTQTATVATSTSTAADGEISGLFYSGGVGVFYDYAQVGAVTLDTGTGMVTVAIQSTARLSAGANPLAVVGNSATTTVNVSNHGNMEAILGSVSISNPGGFTTITVDDSNDFMPRTATLSSYSGSDGNRLVTFGQIAGLSPAPAVIDYVDDDTSSVTINTGTARNTVNVQSTFVPTTIDSAGAYGAAITVGDANGVQDILETLALTSSAADVDTLTLNDGQTHYSSARTVTIGSTSVSGLAFANIDFGATTLFALYVNAGSGGTTFKLNSTDYDSEYLSAVGAGNGIDGPTAGGGWFFEGNPVANLLITSSPDTYFSGIQTINGGADSSHSDDFHFVQGGGVNGTIDGSPNSTAETLDFSEYGNPVSVNYLGFGPVHGQQGTAVASSGTLSFKNIDSVITGAAPIVAVDAPAGGSFTNNNKPTLTATATDVGGPGVSTVQFQYSYDGGAWNTIGSQEVGQSNQYSYTFPTALADGTYTVEATAMDVLGAASTSMPVTFTIDTVPPTITMTSPLNGSSTTSEPTLSATTADNAGGSGLSTVQFQYSTDGLHWAPAGPPEASVPGQTLYSYTFPSLAIGVYDARAVATDNAGNFKTSVSVSFNVTSTVAPISITTPYLANWTANEPGYNQPISTSGGAGPLSFTVPYGNLPNGLTLNAITGVISGTPSLVGAFSFIIQVTDASGTTYDQGYSMTISPALAITATTLNDATFAQPYSQTIATSGGDAPLSFTYSNGTLPFGLYFNSGTGNISGTPAVNGTFPFTVTVTDAAGATASQNLSLTVANAPLTITTTTLPNGTLYEQIYNQTIAISGGSAAQFQFRVTNGSLPGGLVLYNSGQLYGVPYYTGTFDFTVTVTDAANETASQDYSVTINKPPAITTTTLPNWTVNQPGYDQTINAVGGTDPLGLSVVSGNNWGQVSDLPGGREVLAATTGKDGTIYAIGGFDGTSISGEVDAYNPTTNTWTVEASLPNARYSLGATTGLDGTIYAIGGYAAGGPSAEVDAYNPTTNTWTVEASLPAGRFGVAAATGPDGTIYAIGGFDGSNASSEVDAYNPTTNTWTTVASLPSARFDLAATTGSDGTIYAISGIGASGAYSTEVDAYSQLTGWTTIASLPNARATLAATTGLNGDIYALGGVDASSAYSSEVDVYNPTTGMWTIGASLLSGRYGLAAATGANGAIYAIGGSTPAGTAGGFAEVDVYISSQLPPGFTLDPNTGIVSGTPTTTGTYAFTVTVTDATGTTSSQSYTLTINAPPSITTTSLSGGQDTQAYSQTVAVSGGTGPLMFSLGSGSLPDGLTLNGSTGAITGTPDVVGPSSFSVDVTDAAGAVASQNLSISIGNAPLAITTTTLANWTAGQPGYSQTVVTTGGTAPLNFSLVASWSQAGSLPNTRALLAAATGANGIIYAIGGYDGSNAVNAVDAYNPATNSWSPVASLPIGRNSLAAATGLDGTIYAIGGQLGSFSPDSNEVDAYDPTTNAWTTVAALPDARDSLAAATGSNGIIYAIGGFGPSGFSNEVDAYNPATNTWTTVANLPLAREGLAAVAGPNGIIYAIGGGNGSGLSNEVDAYNPATNTWTIVANLPVARDFLAAIAGPNGDIYAIGGMSSSGASNEADQFNPATNTWTTIANLPNAREDLAAAIDANGAVYAIGGLAGNTFASEVDVLSSALDGMTLNPSTGVISGTPAAAGTFPITVMVTDSTGASVSHAYSITINPALAITTTTLANWTVNEVSYSQTVTTSGGTAPESFAVSGGSLPAGLSLNAASGVISGTPTATGAFPFTVTATDASGAAASHGYSITINAAIPITISSVAVNGSSAVINIVSASGDGTTATITTDGTPHGFWVGELVKLTGVTPGGPNGLAGAVTVTGVPSATTFQFASTYNGSETLTGATVTASLAGAQRSMVDSIVYNFTEAVNLTAAAFTITAIQNNPGSTVGIVPTVNVAAVPFTNEWVVTFTDPVNNSVVGHSIANGAYSIAINPAAVTAVSGGQNLSAGETDTFYRLYGDVTGVQSVKNVDANAFNRAWGNFYYTAGYNAALDYNDDGKFTNIDANAFNRAFNTRYSVATTI